jgi:hypothetical protein
MEEIKMEGFYRGETFLWRVLYNDDESTYYVLFEYECDARNRAYELMKEGYFNIDVDMWYGDISPFERYD